MTALLLVKVYGYRSAPPSTHMTIMLSRRPTMEDVYPTSVPPVMAPRLATTWVTVTRLGEKLYWLESIVGYRSWLPWDMKLKPAMRRTR